MTKIKASALVAQAEILRAYIQTHTIPYVSNGMTLAGMDCQGLCEYLLIQAGVPKKECGLAGSNAHWRACTWRGTVKECIAKYGKIPDAAWLFIWTAGHSDKYNDENGEAGHMGITWGKYNSLAASASRGKVIESNFAGKEINGGWNMIGLSPWVDYDVDSSDDSGETTVTETAGTPYVSDMQTYIKWHTVIDAKHECKGSAVRTLQNVLISLGFGLSADGEFGPITDNAVKYFQKTNDLEVDGVVGPATWGALVSTLQSAKG